MNQTTKNIVNMIRDVNAEHDTNVAAYSIDAGFHIFIFCLKNNVEMIRGKLRTTPVISERIERVIETSIDPHGVEPVE